jgi:hypothetical protein
MKISIREIPANDPSARWFWCILRWRDGPTHYENGILPGTENGSWYNARCGYKGTPEEAFAAALKAYREEEKNG